MNRGDRGEREEEEMKGGRVNEIERERVNEREEGREKIGREGWRGNGWRVNEMEGE